MTPSKPSNPGNFAKLKCKQPTTIICLEKTVILGDVTIGDGCIIHPTATIIAKNGPIIIGDNNLFEERTEILNLHTQPMIIGNNNRFEVDSRCYARQVGDNNMLEPKSGIPSNTILTDNCIIAAGCDMINSENSNDLVGNEEVNTYEPFTMISGNDFRRRIVPFLAPNSHNSQLDFLRKILPNYHKLWRDPNIGPQIARSN